MRLFSLMIQAIAGVLAFFFQLTAQAGTPLWTFDPVPGYSPYVSITSTGNALVKYTVTNQSQRSHTLQMQFIKGIVPSGCANRLGAHQSCTLTLFVDGSQLVHSIIGGPVLCEQRNPLQCYRPSQANELHITLAPSPQFFLVVANGDGNEEITPRRAQVRAGTTQQFEVNPHPGYTLSQNVGGNCPKGSWNGNRYTTGAITNNCVVSFSAKQNRFRVTTSGDGNEDITPTEAQVPAGSTQQFEVTPHLGYTVSQAVGGTCPKGSWNGTQYTTGPITSNCNVKFAAFNWDSWIENASDPIFLNAYYPSVSYDINRFGSPTGPLYQMWYELGSGSGIGLAYSEDGLSWANQGTVLFAGRHPVVLYDAEGFGEPGGYHYKMWLWSGTPSIGDASSLLYTKSQDGVTWLPPTSVMQNPAAPINTNSGFFYQLYGPGFVIYNPNATPVTGQPFTYPYVMYFDTAAENTVPNVGSEQTGLAYSEDGITWSAYGSQPVLIPPGGAAWDSQYIYRPSVIYVQGTYHMFYSGSDGIPDMSGNTTAHGIGHAISTDGINWTLDSNNPIFYINEVLWRFSRTYTPFVLYFPNCLNGAVAKMWFTGADNTDAKAIGYATIPCPVPIKKQIKES